MNSRGVFVVSHELNKNSNAVHIEDAIDTAGHGRYNYFLLLACCITNMSAVIDMLGFSVVVPAARCDLQLTLQEVAMLTSISFAGFMFALPWGYFADTRGRRKAILISSSVGFIIAVITSFSTNFLMMLILKFIGSSFSNASITLTTTYLGECVQKKHRSEAIFIQNCFIMASDFVCFGLAYIVLPLDFNLNLWSNLTYKPWRLLSLTLALPLALGALMTLYLHESAKFLANKGETDKALEVLKSIYKINGANGDLFPVTALIGNNKEDDNVSFWDSISKQTVLIFKPPVLWRTIQLFYLLAICCSTNNVFFLWFPTMVNSFYNIAEDGVGKSFCQKIIANISTPINNENEPCNDNTSLNTLYTGMLFSLIFVIVNMAVIKLSTRRKLLLVTTFAISGCSAILVNMFEDQIGSMVLFIMIQFTGICIGTVGSYYVDIYPTSYRALASSLGMMVTRFACLGGVNFIGALVLDHCQLTFYSWAIFILMKVFNSILFVLNVLEGWLAVVCVASPDDALIGGIIGALLLPSDRKLSRK